MRLAVSTRLNHNSAIITQCWWAVSQYAHLLSLLGSHFEQIKGSQPRRSTREKGLFYDPTWSWTSLFFCLIDHISLLAARAFRLIYPI